MIFENGRTIHLRGKNISYVLFTNMSGDLVHYHFGAAIADRDYSGYTPWYSDLRSYAPEGENGLEHIKQEYPAFGYMDHRKPAYTVVNGDKNPISRLKYKTHKIYDGKYSVVGMPSLFAGDSKVQTLEITLADEIAGFDVVLYYSVYDEYDIITRSVKFINMGKNDILVTRALSTNIDLPKGEYDAVYFEGMWTRERQFQRMNINNSATLELSNARGGSGHHLNPFSILCGRNTTETCGEAYGFSLIYSGDHATFISKDNHGFVRVQMGLNPHNFEWKLSSGEEFMTPECVMCYSANGFEELSRNYHAIYSNNLCKSKWSKLPRPVLINNWEGTEFDFNEDKILSMAELGKKIGCELFVLDDGWFGQRDSDTCSLGDWYVNTKKLPSGIDGLAKKINDLGLEFGLWFEPEMINPDSDLYRAHPDWAVHVPNREGSLHRSQYILDLSRDDVCEYIIESVNKILTSANITYVKWDMNRYMTDHPSLGYSHKHVLGFYKIMDGICSAFPDILFEGCASGGGRFDPGVLAYMPQIWTSDNSDAVDRLKIQYSTSFAYPISSISAHVTASPNGFTNREASLDFRGAVAMTGAFGYEFDITKMSDDELEALKIQSERYKSLRNNFIDCEFYRLSSPYENEYPAWETISKDRNTVILFAAVRLYQGNTIPPVVKLRGLDSEAKYENSDTGEWFYGSELMNYGIEPKYENGDFKCTSIIFKKID